MRIFYSLVCAGTFIASSAIADELIVDCEKGSGYAEVFTPQGKLQRFYPSDGPFKARINENQSFTWGYDTGGEMGPYISLGARITLEGGHINLEQATSDGFISEGKYRFSTSKGHSIVCTLRKLIQPECAFYPELCN